MDITSDNVMLATARAGHDAGLCIVPVSEDGEKRPDLAGWKTYQQQRSTLQEITRWFSGRRTGIGVVTGAVSSNLEVLDFDVWETFLAFEDLARARPGRVT